MAEGSAKCAFTPIHSRPEPFARGREDSGSTSVRRHSSALAFRTPLSGGRDQKRPGPRNSLNRDLLPAHPPARSRQNPTAQRRDQIGQCWRPADRPALEARGHPEIHAPAESEWHQDNSRHVAGRADQSAGRAIPQRRIPRTLCGGEASTFEQQHPRAIARAVIAAEDPAGPPPRTIKS